MKKSLMLGILVLINFNSLVFAQWVQTNGPYGGTVRCFAVSGTNLFAGMEFGGVFLSTNSGASWTQVNTGLTNTDVWTLAASPNGAGGTNLFAGTLGGGVFLSTNNGTSWTQVNNGLTSNAVISLALSGTNLFAATPDVVFLSTDNGTSWKQADSGLANPGVSIRVIAAAGTNLFAGTYEDGVFISSNNGKNWKQVNTGLTNYSIHAFSVSDTNLFAGTDDGVFISSNNGTSWKQVNTGLTDTANTGLPYTAVSALAFSLNGAGGTNLFAGTLGGGVFLSSNNGISWTEVDPGLVNRPILALTFSDTNLFAGTEGSGVFLSSNNGTSWTKVNTGLTNTGVYAIAVSGIKLFAGTDYGGVFVSTNSGTSWTQVNNGLTKAGVQALAVSPNGAGGTNLFVGTDKGVFLLTNNGTNWTQVDTGLTNTIVHTLAVSPNGAGGTNLFAGTEEGVFLSTDNGTSWIAVDNGLSCRPTWSLAVSGTNLFAGTYEGGVFLSNNNGTSWTQVNTGLTNKDVYHFAVSGTNLFAGTAGGVFRSTNNGTSWAQVNTGLTNTEVLALASSGTNLFAGTRGGVFLSTDNGTSWKQVNTGLPNTDVYAIDVYALAISPSGADGTNLFAGTIYSGVWKRSLSEIINSAEIPLAALQLWLKSDAGIIENNNRVSKWIDQSGNGNDAVETDTSRQPVLVNNELNGKPVLSFDGINDRLGFTGSKKMSQVSVFAVFKNKTPDVDLPAVGSVFTFGPGGAYNASEHLGIRMRGLPPGSDDSVLIGNGDGPDYVTAASTNMSKYDEWRDISFVTDKTLFNTTLRWNGNDASMAPAGSNLSLSFSLGDSTASGGGIGSTDHFGNLPFPVTMAKCDFAELIVYDTVLSNTDRLAVEKYLNDKYKITITGIADSKSERIPAQFTLYQNYPNPFNPSTNIKYSLPKASFVTLKVYDILGREVASLVNEEKTAGNYQVIFNASTFASGVYFYKIQAGSFAAVKKLLLLK